MGIMRKMYEKFSHNTGERIHDENGYELPDPTPIAPPVGYNPQPTIREQMRAMIREVSLEAANAGLETLDEADDFDIDDEPEAPATDYELDADLPSVAELKRRKEEAEKSAPPLPSKAPKKRPSAPDEGASGTDPAEPDQSSDPAPGEAS